MEDMLGEIINRWDVVIVGNGDRLYLAVVTECSEILTLRYFRDSKVGAKETTRSPKDVYVVESTVLTDEQYTSLHNLIRRHDKDKADQDWLHR